MPPEPSAMPPLGSRLEPMPICTTLARATWLLGGLVVVAAGACAPQGQAGASVPGPSAPVSKKVLTVADTFEPKFIVESYTSEFFLNGNNVKFFVHDDLFGTIQYQNYEPQLAEIP